MDTIWQKVTPCDTMQLLRVIIGSTGHKWDIDNWIKGNSEGVYGSVSVCDCLAWLCVNSCNWCIYVDMYIPLYVCFF